MYYVGSVYICKWCMYLLLAPYLWRTLTDKPRSRSPSFIPSGSYSPHQLHLPPDDSSSVSLPLTLAFSNPFLILSLLNSSSSSFHRLFSLLGSLSLLFLINTYSYLNSQLNQLLPQGTFPGPAMSNPFGMSFQSFSHLFCILVSCNFSLPYMEAPQGKNCDWSCSFLL